MPTTDTDVGRSGLTHPDLNHDGGSLLHGKVRTAWTEISDNAGGRFASFSAVADSTLSAVSHGLGANLNNLKVNIYSGSGDTKTLITDPVAAGWVIAETGGSEKTSIDVTTPSSGGPHTFVVVITDNATASTQGFHLLAALPGEVPDAGAILTHWDTDKRGLAKDSSGNYSTLQTLNPVHVSANFDAKPGNMYIVDTSGGPVTATMPSTINDYDVIGFADATKSWNQDNLTLGRAGNSIDGDAADFVFNTPGDGGVFVGDSTNTNWVRASSGSAGSGSGTGFTNYFTNADFENDVATGVSVGGGTPPTAGAETTTPLFGTQSAKITSGAGTGYVDYAISGIDNAVIDGGILLGLTAYLRTDATSVDNDWTVGIYETSVGEYIGSVPQTNLQGDAQTVFRGTMVPVSGKTYVLRVEFTDTTAAKECDVDGLLLTPDSSTALTKSPVIKRTVTVDNTVLQIDDAAQTGGMNGPVTSVQHAGCEVWFDGNKYFANLSIGVTTGSSATPTFKLAGVTPQFNNSGSASDTSGGATVIDSFTVGGGGGYFGTSFTANVTSYTANYNNIELIGKPSWFDDYVDDNAEINLITPDLLKSNSYIKVGNTSNIVYSSSTDIVFSSEEENVGGGFSYNNSNGRTTVDFTGRVTFDLNMAQISSTSATAYMFVFVNGANILAGGGPNVSSSGRWQWSGSFNVNKGDYFTFRYNTDATLTGNATNQVRCQFFARKDHSIGAHDPVGFGVATSNQYGLVKLDTTFDYLGFSARGLNAGIVNNGTETNFDVSNWVVANVVDPLGGFDPVSGVYTIPAGYSGMWLFHGNAAIQNTNNLTDTVRVSGRLFKGGVQQCQTVSLFDGSASASSFNDNPSAHVHQHILCNEGDAIRFNVLRRTNAGVPNYTSAADSIVNWFQGCFLGKV